MDRAASTSILHAKPFPALSQVKFSCAFVSALFLLSALPALAPSDKVLYSAENATIAQPRASLRVLGSPQEARSRRKFLRYFPGAFRDETYLNWERNYKWNAHLQWNELLGFTEYRALLQKGRFSKIASLCLTVESRTNLLFPFEKMAIRGALKSPARAESFWGACMNSYMALER